MNDDLQTFAANVVANLDVAGAFADWLEERGDPRGVLLRRRWKMWIKERGHRQVAAKQREEQKLSAMRQSVAELRAAGFEVTAELHVKVEPAYEHPDMVFRDYVRRKFDLY